MTQRSQTFRIGLAVIVVLGVIAWLAISGVQANKSYYVTITELQNMGDKAYTRHLRVAGNVEPGSIERNGTHAQFVLLEQGKRLTVQYAGVEPPPDTFKDNSQALAIGTYGHDGVFHAAELQAKCASKYAPAQKPGAPAATPSSPASSNPDKTASLGAAPAATPAN
jgi:cytochrome c-type biogenesis protein CcmE